MGPGIFFFVVGPSGSGKDTLLDGAKARLAGSDRFHFARRVITRPAGSAGEDHEPLDEQMFAQGEAAGDFLLAWAAHGLRYGLRRDLLDLVAGGRHVVANGSRAAVSELASRVPRLVVIEIWAPAEVLAARIRGRGRESGEAVGARLARRVPELPSGDIEIVQVANDASIGEGVDRFVNALERRIAQFRLRRLPIDTGRRHMAFVPRNSSLLDPTSFLGSGRIEIGDGTTTLRAEVALVEEEAGLSPDQLGLSVQAFAEFGRPDGALVTFRRTPSPASSDALRRKIAGDALTEGEFETVVGDIVSGRYPDAEVAGFLVAANRSLTDAEVTALARVRARHARPIRWDQPIVVDKHSMGGIPGSRITLIVVPLVAAHGLVMPKTSSRAITSAAGTADAMETLARVDLTVEEVQETVARARGCIAWNGRLSHSALDDVMNAITRPLGLGSARWSVASILSKKLAAGSTHVVMDLPYGPGARMRDEEEARELGTLLERIGTGLGLTVEAVPTDGRCPIGRGVGPALEVRDVLLVLENRPEAPADLREKALAFASRIIAWDPAVGGIAAARARAESLLASGAARRALDAIIDAQGRRAPPHGPAPLTHVVRADRSGLVTGVNGFIIGGIARRTGAPSDLGGGVDLHVRVGDEVRAGDPLFIIHASGRGDLEEAAGRAALSSGFTIAE